MNTLLEDVEKSNLPTEEKIVIQMNAKSYLKGLKNREDILEKAVVHLNATAEPGKIDEDWISQYSDFAKNVSNETFQEIWARVLAGEANKPGTIPKRLIFVLAEMGPEDAKTFVNLSRFTVNVVGIPIPVVDYQELSFYERFGITYARLLDLTAFGLINTQNNTFADYSFSVTFDKDEVPEIYYYGHKISMPEGMREISSGYVRFTDIGLELYRLLKVEEVDDFWEKICLPFFRRGIENRETVNSTVAQ